MKERVKDIFSILSFQVQFQKKFWYTSWHTSSFSASINIDIIFYTFSIHLRSHFYTFFPLPIWKNGDHFLYSLISFEINEGQMSFRLPSAIKSRSIYAIAYHLPISLPVFSNYRKYHTFTASLGWKESTALDDVGGDEDADDDVRNDAGDECDLNGDDLSGDFEALVLLGTEDRSKYHQSVDGDQRRDGVGDRDVRIRIEETHL